MSTASTSFSNNLDLGSPTPQSELFWKTFEQKRGTKGGEVEFTTDPGLTVFDNTPAVQKLDDKQATEPADPDPPYTFVTRKGEASTVLDKLDKIKFVPGSYGAMSASIAYIRYWKRGGSAQKTAVSQGTTNGTATDPKQQTVDELSKVWSTELKSRSSAWTRPPVTSGLNVPNVNPVNVNYFDKKLTPTNSGFQNSQPAPEKKPEAKKSPSFWSRVGSLISANPSGTSLSSLPGPPSDNGPTSYAAEAAPNPDSAVWQFLFNPEELQLSSGPDFNRAETWGVSDAANHGQPLAWRAHKNRKLTFSKVLLHGYAFGRRVDLLEKGLQDLFMAGSDGPPVLEFVWGKRVFGPCVIQNVQVKEKAWDKGLLVNAEVSFELEQIPEWTINDGFVDVLRPGRQPELNDPRLDAGGMTDQASGDPDAPEPPAKEDGGGGGKPVTPRQQQLKTIVNKCKNAKRVVELFDDIIRKTTDISMGKYLIYRTVKEATGRSIRELVKEDVDALIADYSKAYKELQNYVVGVSNLPRKYTPNGIKDTYGEYYKELGFASSGVVDTDPGLYQFRLKIGSLLKRASESSQKLAISFSESSTCKDAPKKLQELSKQSKKKNEQKYLCNSVKENKPCSIGAGEIISVTCGKTTTTYTCKYPTKGSAQYKSNPRQTVYKKTQ